MSKTTASIRSPDATRPIVRRRPPRARDLPRSAEGGQPGRLDARCRRGVVRPPRPRVFGAALQLAPLVAGEPDTGGGGAEQAGTTEDRADTTRAVLASYRVVERPVLDSVADLLEPCARDRPAPPG